MIDLPSVLYTVPSPILVTLSSSETLAFPESNLFMKVLVSAARFKLIPSPIDTATVCDATLQMLGKGDTNHSRKSFKCLRQEVA